MLKQESLRGSTPRFVGPGATPRREPGAGLTYRRHLAVAAVLLAFTLIWARHYHWVLAEDLSSSYVGCRIVAEGNAGHLYAHDAVLFNLEKDPVWVKTAVDGHYATLGLLHPYVQTPLWAWSLQPLCERTSFSGFRAGFLLLFMLSTVGTIWLVARHWTTYLFHPIWMSAMCLVLSRLEPFRYGIFLLQTHIIFILLTVAAVVLARRGQPVWAGIALALAASVKITPGFLLLYWLTTRQWKAAASFAVSSVVLVAITVAAVGPQVFLAYLRRMSELSHVLLVAFNNQSLAAVVLGGRYPAPELFIWHVFLLPWGVKSISMLLCLLAPIFGGLLDRRSLGVAAPYGAVFAMLATTMATPIAWSHYYILLVVPLMLLLDTVAGGKFDRRTAWALAAMLAILALNTYPLAYGAVMHAFKWYSIARSQFFSGVIALLGMVLLARAQGRMKKQVFGEVHL